MRSPSWLGPALASCVLLATAATRGGPPCQDGPRDSATASPPQAVASSGPVQGLSEADRATFYHRSEGIELVPLSWIKAVRSLRTNSPFLQFPERFGLLPDPDDPDGLPIGITAAPSRGGVRLGRMVGLNCAACHVGEITWKKQSIRLLGGPNLFDLNAFYQELFASVGVALKDDDSRRQFLADLAAQGDDEAAALTPQLLSAVAVAGRLGGADLRRTADLFRTRLLDVVKGTVAEALKRLGGRPPDASTIAAMKEALQAKLDALYRSDLLGLVALLAAGNGPGDMLDSTPGDVPDPVLAQVLDAISVELSLVQARLRFLAGLKLLHDNERPVPGPGRIDAFNGIRDLVFPRADAIAADSPVSYPTLWMLNQTYWLHWDGNTNSVIERNIGQALGQGTPFQAVDQGSYHSLVQPENIHDLELVVRKIRPPDWPAALFGPPEPAGVARGRALYDQHCVRCHAVAPRDGRDILDALLAAQEWADRPPDRRGPPPAIPQPLEKLVPADEVKTDPARAMTFATNVGRQPPLLTGGDEFAAALGQAAWRYSLASYQDNRVPKARQLQFDWPRELVRWQTTRCYVARPLVAIWATAPYLHNASVPTLHDLLLPAKDRPRLFPVGQREYDPRKLGFVVDVKAIPPEQVPSLFPFNATASGNLNVGHEYGTDLSDDDRHALLEFLKTL